MSRVQRSLLVLLALLCARNLQGQIIQGTQGGWNLSSSGELTFCQVAQPAATGLSSVADLFTWNDDLNCVGVGQLPNGQSVLQHWRVDGNPLALILSSSMSAPSSGWSSFAYDAVAGLSYVLDKDSGQVWRFAWDGIQPLPPVASWAPWTNSSQIPELANDIERRVLRPVVIALGQPCAVYAAHRLYGEDIESPMMFEASGQVHSVQWNFSSEIPKTSVLDETLSSEASSLVTARAPGGSAVEVLDSANVVLASGIVQQGSSSVTIVMPSPLVIGDEYRSRIVGLSYPGYGFTCVRRYGAPEVASSGVAIARMQRPFGGYVGNAGFTVAVGLHAPIAAQNIGQTGVLLLAARSSGGIDPVLAIDGRYILDTAVVIPASGVVQTCGNGALRAVVPIPDDQQLAGQVFLLQFGLLDPNGSVKISEVMGVKIEGTAYGAQLQGAGSALARMRGTNPWEKYCGWLLERNAARYDPQWLRRMVESR